MLLFSENLTPDYVISVIIAALVAMTVHEFAHNYVAHLMGDPTPSRLGRLTLNPMAHINWPGFLMFVIIGFGALGSAPINARLMRNPRWGHLAAVAAGPFSNLLLATVFGLILRFIIHSESIDLSTSIITFLLVMVTFNLLLFVFNLLPLFPLDGWHMTLAVLPAEMAYWWQKNAQNTQFVFMGLILLSFTGLNRLLGFDPLGILITDPVFEIRNFILGI